jgi:hypothetical protein
LVSHIKRKHRLRVLENRVLKRIYGPKRDEVVGDWKWDNEELHNLGSSLNIIRQTKSRKMRWAGHVWERREKCTRFGRKAQRKETTQNTQVEMGGWDQSGSWLWVFRMYSVASG